MFNLTAAAYIQTSKRHMDSQKYVPFSLSVLAKIEYSNDDRKDFGEKIQEALKSSHLMSRQTLE